MVKNNTEEKNGTLEDTANSTQGDKTAAKVVAKEARDAAKLATKTAVKEALKDAAMEIVDGTTNVELETVQQELLNIKDQFLRQAAEYDNFRKRTAKERLEISADIKSRLLTDFLPVLDNLERALDASTDDAKYKEGIEMIYQSFTAALEKEGVEGIATDGEPFNPNVHQAVAQVESELESGTIVSTFQKGYMIGGKVIRFAMVAVSK